MTTPSEWYQTHRELLDTAIAAAGSREFWSAYPESPSKSVYGEDAAPAGERPRLSPALPLTGPAPTGPALTRGAAPSRSPRSRRVRCAPPSARRAAAPGR